MSEIESARFGQHLLTMLPLLFSPVRILTASSTRDDEDFSISYLSGLGRTDDCIDDLVRQIICDNDFNFDLWQEVDGVFATLYISV